MPDAQTQAGLDWAKQIAALGSSLTASGTGLTGLPGVGGLTMGTSTSNTTTTRTPGALSSWLQPGGADANMSELLKAYGDNSAYDTTKFDAASEAAQSRVLSQGMASASNAAEEYSNKVRQAGGSSSAAGVIKAQAQIGAMSEAGKLKLEQQKYDTEQKEAAATHSAQIAQTLAGLRNDYLKSLIGYSTGMSGSTSSTVATSPISSSGSGGGGQTPTGGSPPVTSFTPGYIPNSGPLTPATINGNTIPNTVFGSWPTAWNGGMGG